MYYENLLLYDAEYRVVYGEYGMFLLRIGQKEASQKLWKDYKKKEKTELLEEGESRNLKLWEEINEKKSDQRKSKKTENPVGESVLLFCRR